MGSGGKDGQMPATSQILAKGTLIDEVFARASIMVKARVHSTAAYRERLPAGSADITRERVGVIMAVQNNEKGCRADVLWDNGKAFKGYCVGYRGYHDLELAADLSVPNTVLEDAASRSGTSSTYSSPEASTCSTPVCAAHSPSCAQGSGTLQRNASNNPPVSVVSPQAAAASTRMSADPESTGAIQGKFAMEGSGSSGGEVVLDVNVGYLGSAPTVSHAGGKHIWMADGPITYK